MTSSECDYGSNGARLSAGSLEAMATSRHVPRVVQSGGSGHMSGINTPGYASANAVRVSVLSLG